jgi:hypothetical protein
MKKIDKKTKKPENRAEPVVCGGGGGKKNKKN